VCSKRTLVAIGTHDLDTIEGPFSYEALPPKDIRFVPLKHTQEYDGAGIMALYEVRCPCTALPLLALTAAQADTHMRGFLPIIRDSPVYPGALEQTGCADGAG
jgi:phenylalanyl-tRNA synthetase beta chain